MKYRVAGADRETGAESTLIIEASDGNAAGAEANRRGLMVASCDPIPAVQLAVETIQRLLGPLWAKPYGRIGLIVTPVFLLLVVVSISFLRSNRDSMQEHVGRGINADYERTSRGAAELGAQAEEYFGEAKAKRAEAARLREKAAEEDTAVASPKQTQAQAIERDALIQFYLDKHPELKSMLLDRYDISGQLSAHVLALQAGGNLDASDVRYILAFQKKLRELPN